MIERRVLAQRRTCETRVIDFRGQKYQVTAGHYDDGSLGEVFIAGSKAGADMDAVCRDAAVVLSIAIQYGVPLSALSGATTRNPDGSPSTIIGAVIDRLNNDYP